MMRVNYATFTSWRHGGHNICICETLDEVRLVIQDTFDGYEEDERPEMDNYSGWPEVETALEALDCGDNIWIEWDDSTWMTIQRMSFTDEQMEATLAGAIQRHNEKMARENQSVAE